MLLFTFTKLHVEFHKKHTTGIKYQENLKPKMCVDFEFITVNDICCVQA